MDKFKLEYTKESKDFLQWKSRRNGYALKGCIARNTVMVKYELMKRLLKAGREYDAGLSFTKNHPKKMGGLKAKSTGTRENSTLEVLMQHHQ
jgi:hypothetical protein